MWTTQTFFSPVICWKNWCGVLGEVVDLTSGRLGQARKRELLANKFPGGNGNARASFPVRKWLYPEQVSMDGAGGPGQWNHRGHQFSRQLHLQSAPGSPFPSWLLLLRTLAQVNHGKWILFSEYRGFYLRKKSSQKFKKEREHSLLSMHV